MAGLKNAEILVEARVSAFFTETIFMKLRFPVRRKTFFKGKRHLTFWSSVFWLQYGRQLPQMVYFIEGLCGGIVFLALRVHPAGVDAGIIPAQNI